MMEKESCPRCGTAMLARKEPLRVRNAYVGTYNAMSCPVCHYYYFTDDEYDLAWRDARSLGLVGVPFPPKTLPVVAFQEIASDTARRTYSSIYDEFVKEVLVSRFKQDARGRSNNNSGPTDLDLIRPILITECISVGEQPRQ